jgi:hypothetical protein
MVHKVSFPRSGGGATRNLTGPGFLLSMKWQRILGLFRAGQNICELMAGGPHLDISLTVPHICRSQQMWVETRLTHPPPPKSPHLPAIFFSGLPDLVLLSPPPYTTP